MKRIRGVSYDGRWVVARQAFIEVSTKHRPRGWLFKCEYHIVPDMRHSYKLSNQYQYMKIRIADIILCLVETKFSNIHTRNLLRCM